MGCRPKPEGLQAAPWKYPSRNAGLAGTLVSLFQTLCLQRYKTEPVWSEPHRLDSSQARDWTSRTGLEEIESWHGIERFRPNCGGTVFQTLVKRPREILNATHFVRRRLLPPISFATGHLMDFGRSLSAHGPPAGIFPSFMQRLN